MLICVSLLWGICHIFSESRISNKSANTFYRVANPKLVFFNNGSTILAKKFAHSSYDSAHPFRSGW